MSPFARTSLQPSIGTEPMPATSAYPVAVALSHETTIPLESRGRGSRLLEGMQHCYPKGCTMPPSPPSASLVQPGRPLGAADGRKRVVCRRALGCEWGEEARNKGEKQFQRKGQETTWLFVYAFSLERRGERVVLRLDVSGECAPDRRAEVVRRIAPIHAR